MGNGVINWKGRPLPSALPLKQPYENDKPRGQRAEVPPKNRAVRRTVWLLGLDSEYHGHNRVSLLSLRRVLIVADTWAR